MRHKGIELKSQNLNGIIFVFWDIIIYGELMLNG